MAKSRKRKEEGREERRGGKEEGGKITGTAKRAILLFTHSGNKRFHSKQLQRLSSGNRLFQDLLYKCVFTFDRIVFCNQGKGRCLYKSQRLRHPIGLLLKQSHSQENPCGVLS